MSNTVHGLPVSTVDGSLYPDLKVGDEYFLGEPGRLDVRLIEVNHGPGSLGDPKRAVAEVIAHASGLLEENERMPFPGWGGAWATLKPRADTPSS